MRATILMLAVCVFLIAQAKLPPPEETVRNQSLSSQRTGGEIYPSSNANGTFSSPTEVD